ATPASEYVQQLQQVLHDTHALARDQLGYSLLRRKKYYDRKQHVSEVDVGDLVYVLNGASKKGHSRKLQSIYCGPYLVTHRISDILYQIQGRNGKGKQVVHHDRLKLCQDRAIPLWLRRERAEFLNNTVPPAEDEQAPLENLWPEDTEHGNEETPGDCETTFDDHQDSAGEPPTVSQKDSRGRIAHDNNEDQDVAEHVTPFRFPGERRQHSDSSGPRRLTRVSRPPAWLRDYAC
ncbi:MAG: hypothetical protein AAFY26_27425, partial [Cyanobacteria bacterium J06638_22]